MAALAGNVGLLFRIKADGSDAIKELATTKLGIAALAKDAEKAGVSMAAFGTPAAAAAITVAAVGAAAVVAAAALVKLAFSASEFGSKLQDAVQRTGVGVETVQAFGFAAEQAGVGVDKIEASLSKFSVLLGRAELGNKKAQETLAQFGVTATDVDAALGQAITNIAAMSSENEKAAASAALFKDRAGAVIAVIREMKGDLPGAIAKLKEMGAMMSDENVKAAGELGDAWNALTTQIKVGAAKFALEYAPQIKDAITSIGQFVAANKEAWEAWGHGVSNAITGIIFVLNSLGTAANNILAGITLGLSNQVGAWNIWAGAARVAIGIVSGGISEILWGLSKVGEYLNGQKLQSVGEPLIGEQYGPFASDMTPKTPKFGGGSGGGGGGGGGGGASAKDTAEQKRKEAVDALKEFNAATLAEYEAGYKSQLALLDNNLAQKLISEMEYVEGVNKIRLDILETEKQLAEELLENEKLNAKERLELERRIGLLRSEIYTQTIKNSTAVIKQTEKEAEAKKKAYEEEREQARKSADAAFERRKKTLLFLDEIKQRIAAEEAEQSFGGGVEAGLGESAIQRTVTDPIKGTTSVIHDAAQAFTVLGQIGGQAVQSLASGIGNMVQQWVLYGSAGPNAMKKMVAATLAGVAAQAAVLAIMELAYGIAALTPWGAAIYGPAPFHFKAAALFGSVAVATALGGRAIAGDSFNSQTAGGGSGGGGGEGAGQPERLNFTETFNGFTQEIRSFVGAATDRMNEVAGGVRDEFEAFRTQFGVTTPQAVVAYGLPGNAEGVFGAVTDHLDSDLRAASDLVRSQGKMQ